MATNDSNLALIGMPGAGKSTLGVLVAKRGAHGFVDVDLLIQESAGAQLQEIIAQRGVAEFHRIEERCVLSLACSNYVIATGEMRSVREFIEFAAPVAGFDIQWEGSGTEEVGRDAKSGKVIVDVDPRYYRPAEVEQLCGDPSKAREKLGWQPRVTFSELVELMMKADLDELS